MGLALCHRVPRDFVIQLALWLMIVAFILQAVAIGSRNSITSVGYLSNKDTHPSQRVAWIAAHPALYSSGGNTIKICNPSQSVIRYNCARFAQTYHVVNGLILASFITNVLVIIAGLLFFTAFSNTSTGMLRRLCIGVTIPTTLQCAVCGLFFARTIHYAKQDVSNFLINVPANVLAFHRRYAANLMIAATAFLCAADVLVAGRFFYALLIRWRVATSPAPDCTDVQQMMRLHLINDDWQRQKQILRSHAKSVQLQICIKENNGGGGGRQGSSTSIDSSAVHHVYSNLPYVITRSNNEISQNIHIDSNTNTNNNAIVNSDGLVSTDVHAQLPNNLPITSATQGNTILGQQVDIVQKTNMSTCDRGKIVTSENTALSHTDKYENQNEDVSNKNMTNTCRNLINKQQSSVLTVEQVMGTNDVHLYSEESAHNSNNNNNNDYNNNNNNTNSNSNNDDDDYYNGNNNRSINNITHSSSAVHQVSQEYKMGSAKRLHKRRSKSASDKKWDEVKQFSFRRQTSSFVFNSPSIVTLDGAGMRRQVPPHAFVPTDANRSSQRVLLVTSAEMADSVFTNHNQSN